MTEKRKRALMWGLYALLFLLTLILQGTVLGHLPILGVKCVPMPLLFACAAVWTGAEAGALYALLAGLFYALTGAADGPAVLATGVLCAAVSGYACEAFFTRRLFSGLLSGLTGLFLTLAVFYLTRLYFDGGGAAVLLSALRQFLVTAPLCLPMYLLCKWIRKVGP